MPFVTHFRIRYALPMLMAMIAAPALAQERMGSAWTYQGRLVSDGTPFNGPTGLAFSLWDAEDAGTEIGSALFVDHVDVVDGLFTVELDFGPDVFVGQSRWLEVSVYQAGGDSPLTTLSPRQPLTPTPVALGLRGLRTVESGDDVNFPDAWNILGGFSGNSIDPSVHGAVVAGGGRAGFPNSVTDVISTVGGGAGNTVTGGSSTISGGFNNTISGGVATISGGASNVASANWTTVGGGSANTATAKNATVAGGHLNTASGEWSTVPGGQFNQAAGNRSLAAGTRAQADHDGAFVWADSTGEDFASTDANQFLIRANGGVGINKNNPASALDVNGTVTASALVAGTSAPSGPLQFNDANDVSAFKLAGASGPHHLVSNRDLVFNTYDADRAGDNDPLFWFRSDQNKFDERLYTDLMTITDLGRVGIGTAAPVAELDVRGSARVNAITFPDGSVQTSAPGCSGVVLVKNSGHRDASVTCPAGMVIVQIAVGAYDDDPANGEELAQRLIVKAFQGTDEPDGRGWANVGPWDAFGATSWSIHRDDEYVGIMALCACGQ